MTFTGHIMSFQQSNHIYALIGSWPINEFFASEGSGHNLNDLDM
jgi:hypothetical protein